MNISLTIIFFIVAMLYASAGFGGGSSYLAAMAFFGVSMSVMRPTALLCNLVVVAGGTYIFWRNGHFNFKKIIPLSIASVPMAFWGGTMKLSERTFFIILGISLIVAAILLFFPTAQKNNESERPVKLKSTLFSMALGGGIGLLSGMVGIGGGIFLSPILHLLRWDSPKNIAATASFFILLNSVAGLAGQFFQQKFSFDLSFALPLLIAVFIGGQIGSRWSALTINPLYIKKTTAVLIFYAGIQILWQNI